ncbi:MAG: biotin/lipoyl-containing protein [Terriglobales bacterium]
MTYDIVITDSRGQASTHRVELKRAPDPGAWLCSIDGQPFAFDSAQPEADVLSLLVAGRSYEIRRDGIGPNGELSVVVSGSRYAAEVSDPRSLRGRKVKAGSAEGPKKIKAPMPGKVVRILAPEGTAVEAGQGVIVIEAMKMQNELKSPKAGTVKKILAAEGVTVNAGDALAIIE